MRRLALIALALVAACSTETEQNRVSNDASTAPAGEAPVSPLPAGPPGAPPVPETPEDARSPQAAAQVLRRYFALIEAGRYADAWRLWSDGGRSSSMSQAEFAAGFRRYREYRGSVGAPGAMEGAAGSSYIDVPVQVSGRLGTGERFRQSGTMTLRRANDIPGSTAEQRQWRIYRSTLSPAPPPVPVSYRFVGRWATEERNCATRAWRFTADRLTTPASSVCRFRTVTEVPGGYDIAARCTAEGTQANDTLRLRFAESARALLFESDVIADAGLVRCR